MVDKIWQFTLENGTHVVRLRHNWWSGKREISLDDSSLESPSKIWDKCSVHRFIMRGIPCELHSKGRLFSSEHYLYIGGKLVNPIR
jgi:hypothetical protein